MSNLHQFFEYTNHSNLNFKQKSVMTTKKEFLSNFKNLIIEEIELESKNSIWKNSKFEEIQYLTIDRVGRIGEKAIYDVLKKQNKVELFWDGDCNTGQTDGTYDMLIDKKRFEIKTARLGKGGNFQHEGIKQTGWDKLLFVDIAPNKIYLTIIDNSELFPLKRHDVFGIKPHLRRDKHNHKFDLRISHLNKGIISKQTIELNSIDSNENLITNFILNHLN